MWLASVISSGKFSAANASHAFLLLFPSFPLIASLCICAFSICFRVLGYPILFPLCISVLETSMGPSLCLLIASLALPALLENPWMTSLFSVRVFWSLDYFSSSLLVSPHSCWHFLVFFATLAFTVFLVIIVSSQCNEYRFTAMPLSRSLVCFLPSKSAYFLSFDIFVTLCQNQGQSTGIRTLELR